MLRHLFKGVDGFLVAGSLNRDYFRHYGVPDSKLFLLPFAVDNDFFQRRANLARSGRERLRAALGLLPGRPVILFASKFLRRKRAGELMESCRRLLPDGAAEPHPYLLLVGDGEQKAEVEAEAQCLGWSSVRFLGFKNQTELPALLDLCDVFVLPTDSEPLGLIVNEVMNAANPGIVTDKVGAAPIWSMKARTATSFRSATPRRWQVGSGPSPQTPTTRGGSGSGAWRLSRASKRTSSVCGRLWKQWPERSDPPVRSIYGHNQSVKVVQMTRQMTGVAPFPPAKRGDGVSGEQRDHVLFEYLVLLRDLMSLGSVHVARRP